MWRRSENVVCGRSLLDWFFVNVDQLAPAAGALNGCVLRLFTNAFAPNPDMLPADFTEATFGGYASVAAPLGWIGPGNVGTAGELLHVEGNFLATDPIAPAETVNGYWIENAGGTVVMAAEAFATPVPFAVGGDFLSLDVVLELPFVWPVTPA